MSLTGHNLRRRIFEAEMNGKNKKAEAETVEETPAIDIENATEQQDIVENQSTVASEDKKRGRKSSKNEE